MSKLLCVICGVRPVEKQPAVSSTFCRPCASSYDTDGGGDGSVMEAILWAAKRARAGAFDHPSEAAERRRQEDPERRRKHEATQAALGPRNKPSRYGSGPVEEITAPADAKRVQLPDGDTLDWDSGKRSRKPVHEPHVAVVSVTTYARGNRNWRIKCSCGWAWDTSVHGTRRREVESLARSHEKEANATPKAPASKPFEPDWVSPPGETIAELLTELDLTKHVLPVTDVDGLLRGEVRIDEALAAQLAAMLGSSALFWTRRDAQYVADCERLGIKPGSPQRTKSDPPTSPEVQAMLNRDMGVGRRRSGKAGPRP